MQELPEETKGPKEKSQGSSCLVLFLKQKLSMQPRCLHMCVLWPLLAVYCMCGHAGFYARCTKKAVMEK